MKWLFDLGNTRLKWAQWDGRKLGFGAALAYDDTGFSQQLIRSLAALPKADSVWIASVANPACDEAIARHLVDQWGLRPTFVKTSANGFGVRLAYSEPERFGVDRFLGLIALHQSQSRPAVLVSCGTALVLDALAADGRHLGGLIVPSPALMQRALIEGTARIGAVNPDNIVEIADNTADAVHSGAWLAVVSLVERFLGTCATRFGLAPDLILTGGGASQLKLALDGKGRIEENLVLRGLARYADHERP